MVEAERSQSKNQLYRRISRVCHAFDGGFRPTRLVFPSWRPVLQKCFSKGSEAFWGPEYFADSAGSPGFHRGFNHMWPKQLSPGAAKLPRKTPISVRCNPKELLARSSSKACADKSSMLRMRTIGSPGRCVLRFKMSVRLKKAMTACCLGGRDCWALGRMNGLWVSVKK